MKGSKISRVDIQVSILTAALVAVSVFTVFLLTYSAAYGDMIDSLQERARGIYAYVEERLDKQTFLALSAPGDEEHPAYHEVKSLLEDVKNVTGVMYLYTGKRLPSGELVYVIDGLDAQSPDFRGVGAPIEEEIAEEMSRALEDEVILPDRIMETSWGHIFISYFPIHDDGGRVIGVLGIEFEAGHQYATYRSLRLAAPFVALAVCAAAVAIAVNLFKRISNPSFSDLSTTDLLTGLKNRNAFETDMNNLSHRKERQGIGLLSADLNGLKTVNDTLGHQAGDAYIRRAADALRAAVQKPHTLYRVGGDEFAAILSGVTEEAVRELAVSIEAASREAGRSTLAVGFALYSAAGDRDLFDTYRRADARMYEDKRVKKEAESADCAKCT